MLWYERQVEDMQGKSSGNKVFQVERIACVKVSEQIKLHFFKKKKEEQSNSSADSQGANK